MKPADLARVPGFRRRFRITPTEGRVCSELEDDIHCMTVTLGHDGVTIEAVEAQMQRAPWTTCPGARSQLADALIGAPLTEVVGWSDKQTHCTHLYDLAELAAAHALDLQPLQYEVLVSDPIEGKRYAEIRSKEEILLSWTEEAFHLVEPAELAGTRLDRLGAWIRSLPPASQEAARLLRWGNMVANGRLIPLAQQSDATRMPPNCYTFQPERAARAERVGIIYDFSKGDRQPLAGRQDVGQR